jgi:urea transport system permease protein
MNKGLCVLAIAWSMVFQLDVNLSQGLLFAADQAPTPASASPLPVAASPIEQALIDINSEEASVRDAAADVLIEQGDAALIPRLDAIRAEGSRPCAWPSSRSWIC